jgi:hypothetical protein
VTETNPNNPLDLRPGDVVHPTGSGWYDAMTAPDATGTVTRVSPTGAIFVMDDPDISRDDWVAFECGDDMWAVELVRRAGLTPAGLPESVVGWVASHGRDVGIAEVEVSHDPVNHPSHYKRGGLEAIDVMEAFDLHRDGRLFNAGKYVLRAGQKDKESQDVRKAIWYLERYAADLESRGL